MESHIYYFLLLRRNYISISNNERLSVTMNELAEVLSCTHRNVKLILSKLMEDSLIGFVPGRGRGNHSTIIFLKDLESVLLQQAENFIKSNDVNRALELVKEFGQGTKVQTYIINWVNGYFGYNRQNEDSEILRFPIFRPITTLDPVEVFFDLDAHLIKQVYNTLTTYNHKTGEYTGCLAHAWDTNEDKTKWIFYLRKGIKFHNGKLLTAEDVKLSFDRLVDSPHCWLVNGIKDIQIIGKHTIVFYFQKSHHLFLQYVSFTPMSVMDTSFNSNGFVKHPIGTGPYKLSDVSSDKCVLDVFEDYFTYRPHLDRIEIIRLSEEVESWDCEGVNWQKLWVETGESNITTSRSMDNEEEVISGTTVLSLNTVKNGPLQNASFRKLLGIIIHKQKLVEELGEDRVSSARGLFFDQNDDNPCISTEEISTRLIQVNYQEEPLYLYTYKRHYDDAKWIQARCHQFNIQLTVKIVEWDEIRSKSILSLADMILFEATVNEGEISQIELYQLKNGFIYPFLDNDLRNEVDKLVNQIKQEESVRKRAEKLHEIELLLKTNNNLIFLAHKKMKVLFEPSLKGVTVNARMWVDFKDIWFVPEGI